MKIPKGQIEQDDWKGKKGTPDRSRSISLGERIGRGESRKQTTQRGPREEQDQQVKRAERGSNGQTGRKSLDLPGKKKHLAKRTTPKEQKCRTRRNVPRKGKELVKEEPNTNKNHGRDKTAFQNKKTQGSKELLVNEKKTNHFGEKRIYGIPAQRHQQIVRTGREKERSGRNLHTIRKFLHPGHPILLQNRKKRLTNEKNGAGGLSAKNSSLYPG